MSTDSATTATTASSGSLSAHRVTVLAQHTLRCSDEASMAAIESPYRLGPLDQLVLPFVPIAVVFVYRASTSSAELIPVERLQRALSLLLNSYPHLTGRLQINSGDNTPEITRLGTGAALITAECSAPLDAFYSTQEDDAGVNTPTSSRILVTDLPDGGNALLAPFDPTPEGVCRDPIFTIQHTRFSCGGVALGVRLHHILCDSDGFFQLVRDLAELYRGLREEKAGTSGIVALARPPHIRSYLAELSQGMTPEERQAALAFQPAHFYVEPTDREAEAQCATESEVPPALSEAEPLVAQPPVLGRILRFSGRELDALKAHATDPNGGSWVSTFEALSAHIYQCVYRARLKLRTAQGVPLSRAVSEVSRDFLTSVNWRGSDRLALPPRYFPNAIFCPYTSLTHDVLGDGPLWQVAKAIHDLTRTMSPKEARHTLEWIAAQPDKSRVKHRLLALIPSRVNGCFLVSQWCKFDMYVGVDFDVDEQGEAVTPALVSPPFTVISLLDGLAYFLATEEQLLRAAQQVTSVEGSPLATGTSPIDVSLALSEPLWAILDQDEHFRQFRYS